MRKKHLLTEITKRLETVQWRVHLICCCYRGNVPTTWSTTPDQSDVRIRTTVHSFFKKKYLFIFYLLGCSILLVNANIWMQPCRTLPLLPYCQRFYWKNLRPRCRGTARKGHHAGNAASAFPHHFLTVIPDTTARVYTECPLSGTASLLMISRVVRWFICSLLTIWKYNIYIIRVSWNTAAVGLWCEGVLVFNEMSLTLK